MRFRCHRSIRVHTTVFKAFENDIWLIVFILMRFRPSTLRYVRVYVLIHFQERFQIDAFSMKTLSVLVSAKASRCLHFHWNENAFVWTGPNNSKDNKTKWKHWEIKLSLNLYFLPVVQSLPWTTNIWEKDVKNALINLWCRYYIIHIQENTINSKWQPLTQQLWTGLTYTLIAWQHRENAKGNAVWVTYSRTVSPRAPQWVFLVTVREKEEIK